MYMEGSESQIFDIGLSCCFIVCRRWKLGGKKIKKIQSYPIVSEISEINSHQQNIRNFVMCIISLNEENTRHYSDVLFLLLPYLDQEKSPFF